MEYNLFQNKDIDILLVNPPPWNVDIPPLGIATLSSFLRDSGIKSTILDINIDLYHRLNKSLRFLFGMDTQEYWIGLKGIRELVNINPFLDEYTEDILRHNPKIVGFSAHNPREFFTIELIKRIRKKSSALILIGGGAAQNKETRNIFTKDLLGIKDICFILGDGEPTTLELIRKVLKNESIKGIEGIIYWDSTGEIEHKPRVQQSNLDGIYFPDYLEFDLAKYRLPKNIQLEWSRGCIANCVFCQVRSINGKYRIKSGKKRFEEFKYLFDTYGIDTVTLTDSLINGNVQELEIFCDLTDRSNVRLRWSGQVLASLNMTAALFNKMKKAGCYRLEFGVETGSDFVLRKMKKPASIKIIEQNLKDCKAAGIMVVVYIIIGFPGEDEEEFSKTLEFMERNKDVIDLVRSYRQPYLAPGAYMDSHEQEYGIVRTIGDKLGNKWSTKENTYEIRMNRIKRFSEKIAELGIKGELFDH
ncbi:MAG: radical SAM protein [archaeon]